jgi:hypothetical protein
MPMNSVQETVKTALTGLTMPTYSGNPICPTPQVWIAPPVIGDFASAPQIYVWGGVVREKRQTMGPRGTSIPTSAGTFPSGFRDAHFTVDIWIKYAMENDDVLEDSKFPLIIDTVMQELRGMTMPVLNVTDSITGWVTNITHIGEDFTIEYGAIRELEDQRFWLYEAHIAMMVYEKIQQ